MFESDEKPSILVILALMSFSYFACPRVAAGENSSKTQRTIEGHIQIDDALPTEPNLIGKWNGYVTEYKRHPTVSISSQQDHKFSGTYKGIFGKFPLTGYLEADNSTIKFYVDFKGVKFRLFKPSKPVVAVMDGKLDGNTIYGTAVLVDYGSRPVHFSANKEPASEEVH
jgi:hypothetical protein